MPFRILHTADLHLDLPIGGAGPTPPALTGRLATAALDTLDRLVDLAVADEVDAVLVAGGLWLGGQTDPVARRRVIAALERLAQGSVAAVVARQRGERLDLLLDPARLPGRVHLPDPDRTEVIELTGRDGTPLVVTAASGRDGLRELCRRLATPEGAAAPAAPAAPAAVRAAGAVAQVGLCPLPPRHATDPDPPLAGTSAHYWALGGRMPGQIAQLGTEGGWIVMPGPPQLHQPGDPGTGCSVALADLDGTGPTSAPRWRPVAAVELVTVALALPSDDRPAAVEDLLDEQASRYATAVPDRPVLFRAILHGVGPGRAALAEPAALEALLDRLRRRAEGRLDVWWADVRVALVPGPVAQRLTATDRRAAELVRSAGRARRTAAIEVLDRHTADGRGALPGGAAWDALVTEGTSLGLDLLVATRPVDDLGELVRRLADVERHLLELDIEAGRPPGHDSGDPARAGEGDHSALDDDIIATEAQLDAARADEARLLHELDALASDDDAPASTAMAAAGTGQTSSDQEQADGGPGRPMDAADRQQELGEALRRRHHAQAELDAATTTATVLRLGIERSVGDGPAWLRWVQPVALAVASASVLVAVALLTSGVSRAGIAVAVVALLSAAASLVLPARPLREPQDVTRMRTRLEQADDDIRFWDGELSARAERAAAIAGPLGLPADVGEDDLRHLGPASADRSATGVDDASGANRGTEVRTRELSVARNTASAAAERVAALRRERDERDGRADPTAQTVREAGTAGAGAGAEVKAATADATCSPRAVLHQEHRGLADELNRRRWTLDRRAVATWLLAHSAARAAQPAHAAGPPDEPVGPSVDPSAPTGGRAPERPVDPGIRVLVTPAE
jgi:exonuclease SbcD